MSTHIALACSGLLLGSGCGGNGPEQVAPGPVSLEIRFQDDAGVAPLASEGRLASPATGPTTHDTVSRVQVDISFADSGQPFFLNFDLTEIAPDVWRGDVPILPRNRQLRFAARALSVTGDLAFSGETLATLSIDNQSLQIPLAPVQDGQTFPIPRLFRIVYPTEVFAGQEEQITFTVLGNAGASIGIEVVATAAPSTPAAELSPATGTVTLTSTVADFMTVYTPPEVTADTTFNYQVTITDSRAQSAVAVTTNFTTLVKPRPPGTTIVRGSLPSVLFSPVILRLTANGSETPGTVELVADVSDDSPPEQLTFQWAYAPEVGTPAATFANSGQGNPGFLQGYTVTHEGTITLAVTDEHGGTTTLHYPVTPGQFADAIDHASVDGLRRIVSGDAHTCVLTGQKRVRCWGDNQSGQLGYGHDIDVGDAATRLPFTAGDVPLPASDPVQQLVAGNNHTCVLLESGLAYCWGDNQFGQLGYNHTQNLGDGEPVTSFGFVTLGDLATRIAAGGDHTCAILQSGALRCWGRNDFGQLGRGSTANLGDNETVFSAGDVDLGAGVTVKDLALGGFHTCALLSTGAVRCWGRNDSGQLGYGHSANLGDDEPIDNLPDVSLTGTVRKLVAGERHSCALSFAGTLRCWGESFFGQLGQSFPGFLGIGSFAGNVSWGDQANELPSTLPSDVITGGQVTDVAAGDRHTCALSSDGQLRCWGRGDSGQLGDGSFTHLLTPPLVGVDLDGVTAYRISAGAAHTCALRSNGTARCWGAGGDGRLGRGSTAASGTATGDADIQIFALRFTIGGTVTDLTGAGLVLQNNGGDDLAIAGNGTFAFATPVESGATYNVGIKTQPSGQPCTVTSGAGTVGGSNVTSVRVLCGPIWSASLFPIAVFGNAGSGDLGLDNHGDLLVSTAGADTLRVSRVTGAGTTLDTNSFDRPFGIAYRAGDNAIYTNTRDGQVFRLTSTGRVTIASVSNAGVLNALAIAPPGFGSFGGFIIGVTQGGSVVAVNPSGGAVTTITAAAGAASDLAFAPDGTLYICGGTTVRTVTAAGVVTTFATGLSSADGLTITPDGTRMFIADSGTDTIRQVTIPGGVVTTFAPADIDGGSEVGGILAVPGDLLIVMTGETSLRLRAFPF